MDWEFLDTVVLGNTLWQYLGLAGAVLFAFIFKTILSKGLGLLFFRLFKRFFHEGSVNVFITLVLSPIKYFVVILTIYIAVGFLKFPEVFNFNIHDYQFKLIVQRLMHTIVVLSIVWIFLRVIDFIARIFAQKATETGNKLYDQLVPFVRDFLKVVAVILGSFFILGAIFHFNVNALMAGVGIGGLAIALAAKDSMENLFASFIIFADRPFTLGDTIKVGDVTGTVEYVGFRSTRIRTGESTFLTVPNSKIVNSNLDNLTLRTHQKVEFKIGLSYRTSPEQIKSIMKETREGIASHLKVANPTITVIFQEFGESSLNILVSYLVPELPQYNLNKTKEEINFKILEIVERNNAEFAFPTRKVLLNNDKKP